LVGAGSPVYAQSVRALLISLMLGPWLVAGAAAAQPAATATSEPVDESLRGDTGESCRARIDCKTGLKCIDQVCVDPLEGQSCQASADCGARLRCVDRLCVRPSAVPAPIPVPVPTPAPEPAPASPTEPPLPGPPTPAPPDAGSDAEPPAPLEPVDQGWMSFTPGDGVHPYAGVTFAPGVFLGLDYASGATTGAFGSFLFAFRGGVMFDRTALELEISPMTWVPVLNAGTTTLNVNLSVGTYNQLADGVYWPTRFGLGLQHIGAASETLFQTRLDLIGVAFNIGHVLVDFYAPSFRFTTEFDQLGTFNWLFGAGGAYVF
jgi:hypothetical protein